MEITADGKTLADAGLSALDVLYDSDGESVEKSTLGARIRLAVESADLSGLALTWEVAGLLRTTLSRGRPIDVADLGRADGEDLVGRAPDAAEIVGRATVAKDGLAAAVAAGTAAALTPYGIWPPSANPDAPLSPEEEAVALEALLLGAQQRVLAAEALLARTTPAGDPPAPKVVAELGVQALAAVFGTGFVAVPVIGAAPAGEPDRWAEAVGPSGVTARVGADIRPWLARAGTLRDATSAYGEIVLVREATGTPPHAAGCPEPGGRVLQLGRPAVPGRRAAAGADPEHGRSNRSEPTSSGAVAGVVSTSGPRSSRSACCAATPPTRTSLPSWSTSRRPGSP